MNVYDPTKHRIVFLGGLHKSGTSLLFKCLRHHPDISGFEGTGAAEDEGQHLQSVYPPAKAFGGPGRFGFNQASYMDESSNLVLPENASRLFLEWGKYWNLEKHNLIEKSPPNLVRSRFLQALFPGSAFVMLMRHPVAVSYATQKWSKTSLDSLIRHWIVCHERFFSDNSHLKNVLVVRYEHFIEKPQDILDQIYAFLGIAKAQVNEKISADLNEKYFSRWKKLQQGLLGRFYVRRIIGKYEKRVNALGYSLLLEQR